jgi:cytochrome c
MSLRISSIAVSLCAMLGASLSANAFADAARGKALYDTRCIGCHSVDDSRVGPLHRGVVGRKVGSVKDYDYSPALRASKIVWDVALLQKWLTNPEALIPGQRMGYSVDEAKDRLDLAEYLATLK